MATMGAFAADGGDPRIGGVAYISPQFRKQVASEA